MEFESRLCAEVESRREQLVALTQDLIRIPSLNPPGQYYRDVCELLSERLGALGFQAKMVRAKGAPGDSDRYPRWNLVARREGARRGSCLHFNSHFDVVEVGHGWTVDPFGGAVIDGRIYGRGACDMKGGLATSIIACAALIAVAPDFAGALEISASADEESGGFAGAAWLAQQGYFRPDRVQHVIIPEPLHKDRVCLGHRGVWWAEIETEGHIAHGSMPFQGDCAIRHMGAVVEAMERDLFPLLATRHTDAPITPEGARIATLNINSIHGGPAEEASGARLPTPCVPDRARIVIDRRVLPEESVGAARVEMRRLLDRLTQERPGFRYTMRDLFTVDPSMTARDAPVASALSRAIARRLGREAEFVLSPGTYDQKHVDRIGGVKDCVAYGPGLLDVAHQPDEYIAIDDMEDAACVMALAAADLLRIGQGD